MLAPPERASGKVVPDAKPVAVGDEKKCLGRSVRPSCTLSEVGSPVGYWNAAGGGIALAGHDARRG